MTFFFHNVYVLVRLYTVLTMQHMFFIARMCMENLSGKNKDLVYKHKAFKIILQDDAEVCIHDVFKTVNCTLFFFYECLARIVQSSVLMSPGFFAKHLQRSFVKLAVVSNFHHQRPHRGIEFGTFRFYALTTRPRIHCCSVVVVVVVVVFLVFVESDALCGGGLRLLAPLKQDF